VTLSSIHSRTTLSRDSQDLERELNCTSAFRFGNIAGSRIRPQFRAPIWGITHVFGIPIDETVGLGSGFGAMRESRGIRAFIVPIDVIFIVCRGLPELRRRVLARIFIKKCSLRLHMVALGHAIVRRPSGPALNHFLFGIATASSPDGRVAASACTATDELTHNPPMLRSSTTGAAKIVTSLANYLQRSSLVTRVKAGHIGKTTVSLGTSKTRRLVRWRRRKESFLCRR
jgi:hypothetical protein